MCQNEKQEKISRTTFNEIFEDNNISIYHPKKDQCDTCCAYQTKNIDYIMNDHIKDKDRSRYEKQKDKERAINNEVKIYTMDLQAVKIYPSLKASALYYKCKLCVHNFTMYNLSSHECTCYWWDEIQSDLSASSFTSCIIDQITESNLKNPIIDNIILSSDACCYQNRNCTGQCVIGVLCKKTTIEQKYLTKGYTQMKCDSLNATIERKLKNMDIYLLSDYVKITKNARIKPIPYKVEYYDLSFFKKYEIDSFRYESIRLQFQTLKHSDTNVMVQLILKLILMTTTLTLNLYQKSETRKQR